MEVRGSRGSSHLETGGAVEASHGQPIHYIDDFARAPRHRGHPQERERPLVPWTHWRSNSVDDNGAVNKSEAEEPQEKMSYLNLVSLYGMAQASGQLSWKPLWDWNL